jgi:hypothetical protein
MRSNAAKVARSLFACFGLLFLPLPRARGQATNLPNELGTMPAGNVQLTTCPPGGVAGTCYNALVPSYPASGSCYEVVQPASTNPPYTAMLKISTGASPVRGTVFFVSGGGGNVFYDTDLRFGINLVNQVLNSGYDVIQFAFYTLAGWQQAANPAPVDGPRALACTYGTIVKWATQNSKAPGTLCATGHSSGSSVLAYALSIYGLGDPTNKYPGVPQFSMVEATSGPPHARLDIGCSYQEPHLMGPTACGTPVQESYQSDAKGLIDPSYPEAYCSACQRNKVCMAGSTFEKTKYPFFFTNSVLSGDELLSFPKTDVHLLYGTLDSSAASPLGYEWAQQVSGTNGRAPSISCVPDAGHRIPDVIDGAAQIASDLVTYCVAQ